MPLTISRDRLVALIGCAKDRRVAVVGDAMVDVYLRGDVERISPEAPVPVVRVRERRYALGGAANVAQNVVAIGSRCHLVAAVGRDAGGERLRGMLGQVAESAGTAAGRAPRNTLSGGETETDWLVDVARPTTTKTRIVARSQQLVRVDEEEEADLEGEEVARLLESVDRAVASAHALILEDYNKGVLVPAVIQRAIVGARAREIPIVVDPKYRNFFLYRGATIFKPNRRELEAALGATVDLEHPDGLPEAFRRLGVDHLLLTLGEHGMALISRDGDISRVPTAAREVYDVVGAGDTVTAYLAAILAAGGTPGEAAVIANYAAGVEVGKLGAATVTPDEVIASYDAFLDA